MNNMAKTQKELQPQIKKVLSRLKFSDSDAEDIAFHLTDWLEDLEKLNNYLDNPKNFSDNEAYDILNNFLLHAPSHIVAAVKLMTDDPVMDIFGVKAVKE